MMRIDAALSLVVNELNTHLQGAFGGSDWAILSNPVDREGQRHQRGQNKILAVVAGIGADTPARRRPAPRGTETREAPPLALELLVLFFANFEGADYPRGLAAVSETMAFFHRTPLFTRENLPGLDQAVDRVVFEPHPLDIADLERLMDLIGVIYRPCVCYSVRLIPPA